MIDSHQLTCRVYCCSPSYAIVPQDNQVPFPLAQDDDGSYSRSVSLLRANGGFGFTLRHFVIYPPDLINKSNEVGRSKPSPQISCLKWLLSRLHSEEAPGEFSFCMITLPWRIVMAGEK